MYNRIHENVRDREAFFNSTEVAGSWRYYKSSNRNSLRFSNEEIGVEFERALSR